MSTRFPLMKTATAEALRAEASRGQGPLLTDRGAMPELDGATGWLNSAPLQPRSLRGKVVLVDFWTYTCINSLRPLPYLKSWAAKYKDAGLVFIGVHTPEFSFERERQNVEDALRSLNVRFPVAIDSDYGIWNAFHNEYWPAQYLIDGKGRIRYQHFGEGEYEALEQVIQQLLKENGVTGLDMNTTNPSRGGCRGSPGYPEWEISRDLCRLSPRGALRLTRTISSRFKQGVQPTGQAVSESVGTERRVECRGRGRRAQGNSGENCLPVPQPRSAPGAGSN